MKKLVSWVEIPANDLERAVKFYNELLGVSLEIMDFGSEAMACFPGGEGAISKAPGFEPSLHGVLVSFNNGKEIEDSLEMVRKMGGTVIQPKTRIEAEGRGYFALITDSEGNKIGLYQDL